MTKMPSNPSRAEAAPERQVPDSRHSAILQDVGRRRKVHALTSDEGFSLTELMVVIVIIGILAMLAIPKFLNVTTQAKMTEAQMMLQQVHTLQQAYMYRMDRYATSLQELGFEQQRLQTDGGPARYQISIERADAAGFSAAASAIVDFNRNGVYNVWDVSEDGVVKERTPD